MWVELCLVKTDKINMRGGTRTTLTVTLSRSRATLFELSLDRSVAFKPAKQLLRDSLSNVHKINQRNKWPTPCLPWWENFKMFITEQSKQVKGGGASVNFQSIYLLSRHFNEGGKQIILPIGFFCPNWTFNMMYLKIGITFTFRGVGGGGGGASPIPSHPRG